MALWMYDSERGVIRCYPDHPDEDIEWHRGKWRGAEKMMREEYGFIDTHDTLDGYRRFVGEEGFCEAKSCHVRRNGSIGKFLLKRDQQRMLRELGGWYFFAVLDRISKREWDVADHTLVRVENVDELVKNRTWTEHISRDYEYVKLSWKQVPGIHPVDKGQESFREFADRVG